MATKRVSTSYTDFKGKTRTAETIETIGRYEIIKIHGKYGKHSFSIIFHGKEGWQLTTATGVVPDNHDELTIQRLREGIAIFQKTVDKIKDV